MPFRRLIVPAAVLLAMAGQPVLAIDPNEPSPPKLNGRTNAALLYYQAFERLSMEGAQKVREEFKNTSGWYPDEALTKILVANQRYVDDIITAANTSACDFGIQYDQGFDALLPQLGKLRTAARVLAADARRCLRENDESGVAKRLSAIFRIAEQTRNDRILISSLVGTAICSLGLRAGEALLSEQKMTPTIARAIHTALKEQNAEDLFGTRTAVQTESDMVVVWGKRKFTGASAGADFLRSMSASMGMGASDLTNPLAGMNEAQLHADLDQLAKYYEDVKEAWDKPDAADRLAKFEERTKEGGYGHSAKIVGAAFGKALASNRRIIGERERGMKRLEAFLRGEDYSKLPPVDQPVGGATK